VVSRYTIYCIIHLIQSDSNRDEHKKHVKSEGYMLSEASSQAKSQLCKLKSGALHTNTWGHMYLVPPSPAFMGYLNLL